MPELPEIETLTLELKKVLKGREISRVEILNDSLLKTPRDEFERRLPGRAILAVQRRGKFIRIDLSEGLTLWFHLGMTGRLLFEEIRFLKPHTHFILSLVHCRKSLVYRDARRFGRIRLSPSREEEFPEGVRRLGREPQEWERGAFVDLLKTRRGRIKSLLLNQTLVAGLGNIYADESLYRAGIRPLQRANLVSRGRLARLHEAIGEVLEEAIRWGGSSIDDYFHLNGERGRFQDFHRVYGRAGEACPGCGTPIRKIKLSGRTSSFCPHCQR